MIVKESISFKRGIEPKESMNLGNDYIYDIEEDLSFEYNIQKIKILIREYIPDINDNEIKRFLAFELSSIIDLIPEKYFSDLKYKKINAIFKNTLIKVTSNWMSINSDKVMGYILNNSIEENLNFKRGIDPRDAMKIGKYGYTPDDFKYWTYVADKIGYKFKRLSGTFGGDHTVKLQKKGTKQMLTLELNIKENTLYQIMFFYSSIRRESVNIPLDDIDQIAKDIEEEIRNMKNIL